MLKGDVNLSKYLEVELSGSTIRNGRIYFDRSDSDFFPSDSFGDRTASGGRGTPVEFVAGPDVIISDIRYLSEKRIGPRKSFAGFFKSVRAVEGGKLRALRIADRRYKLEYLG